MNCVDKPEYAKKTGTSTFDATGSMERLSVSVSRPRGRNAPTTNATNTAWEAANRTRSKLRSRLASTTPSRVHAIMSSTEPAASASVPSAVPPMPRSWMMRASTGNAVTDIAAPRYIMLCQLDTFGVKKRPSAYRNDASAAPSRKGKTTPASEISMAPRYACLMNFVCRCIPTTNM